MFKAVKARLKKELQEIIDKVSSKKDERLTVTPPDSEDIDNDTDAYPPIKATALDGGALISEQKESASAAAGYTASDVEPGEEDSCTEQPRSIQAQPHDDTMYSNPAAEVGAAAGYIVPAAEPVEEDSCIEQPLSPAVRSTPRRVAHNTPPGSLQGYFQAIPDMEDSSPTPPPPQQENNTKGLSGAVKYIAGSLATAVFTGAATAAAGLTLPVVIGGGALGGVAFGGGVAIRKAVQHLKELKAKKARDAEDEEESQPLPDHNTALSMPREDVADAVIKIVQLFADNKDKEAAEMIRRYMDVYGADYDRNKQKIGELIGGIVYTNNPPYYENDELVMSKIIEGLKRNNCTDVGGMASFLYPDSQDSQRKLIKIVQDYDVEQAKLYAVEELCTRTDLPHCSNDDEDYYDDHEDKSDDAELLAVAADTEE